MVLAKTKLTYADYLQTSDDVRYELIDGELVLMPSPRIIHQILLLKLASLLDAFVEENFIGRVLIGRLRRLLLRHRHTPA